ncbi:MAG: VOC family protein [Pseudomonadota bacterium]
MSDLGAFSMSLPVKDLSTSIAFYEKLGFTAAGGGDKWMMMRMGDKVIGLFEGMFDKPMLTFNPGWSQGAENLDRFTDIREIQKALKAQGIQPEPECDPASTGPASLVVTDPDGNPILIDQHR